VIKIITIFAGGNQAGSVHLPPGQHASIGNVWYSTLSQALIKTPLSAVGGFV